jgi:hypothetical protein
MSTQAVQSDEVSLKEVVIKMRRIFRFLLSKWLLIFLISSAGLLIGFFYASSKKPLYVADTSFSLDEEKSGGGGALMGLAASFGFDMGSGGSLFTNENILQLFGSKKIIHAALLQPGSNVNQTHADQLLEITGLRTALDLTKDLYPVGTRVESLSRFQDSVMDLLHRRVTGGYFTATKPDKKVDIYHVVVQSPDETFSSSFSKAIVDQVSQLYTEIKTTKSKQTVEILQKRVDSLRGSFSRALYGQAAILDANLNPTFKSATVGAMQKQTEITTSSEAYKELLKNLEMSKYALLKQSPLFQIIDAPRFPLEKKKPSRLMYGLTGGFIAAFIIIIFLLARRFLSSI